MRASLPTPTQWPQLKRMQMLWQLYGLKAVYKQFRYTVKRPFSKNLIKKYAPRGLGLELGVGRQSIAPLDRTILSDSYQSHAQKQNLAKVIFPAYKIPYPDESFDFILSEHVLEHISNPLKTLTEWKRILKKDGVIFLFLPHKDRTFDRLRARTTLAHLIDDFKNDVPDNDATHVDEFIKCVLAKGLAKQYQNMSAKELCNNGSIHHHVWISQDAKEFCQHMGFQVLECIDFVPDRGDSFCIVCKK